MPDYICLILLRSQLSMLLQSCMLRGVQASKMDLKGGLCASRRRHYSSSILTRACSKLMGLRVHLLTLSMLMQ